MIRRTGHLRAIENFLAESPVCALLGPRLCGKTTLAKQFAARRRSHWFDLEGAQCGRENPDPGFSAVS